MQRVQLGCNQLSQFAHFLKKEMFDQLTEAKEVNLKLNDLIKNRDSVLIQMEEELQKTVNKNEELINN